MLCGVAPRIDIIFDVPADSQYYQPTLDAVGHAAEAAGLHVEVNVVRTPEIDASYFERLPEGVFIGPGTPYEVPSVAEEVIRTAREKGLPLVGT